MEIVYCDVCGFRIPDSQIAEGHATRVDGKAYCVKCLPRVAVPTRPSINRMTAAAAAARKPSGGSAVPGGQTGVGQSGRTTSSGSDPTSAQSAGKSAGSNRVIVGIAAGVAVGVLVAGLALTRSGPKPSEAVVAETTPSDVPSTVPVKERAVSPEPVAKPVQPPLETPRPEEAPRPDVPAINPPPEETPKQPADPEALAQEAFLTLNRFEGLADDDWPGRIARVDAFLTKYEEARIGARARVLLYDLQRRAAEEPAKTPTKPDTPVAVAPVQPPTPVAVVVPFVVPSKPASVLKASDKVVLQLDPTKNWAKGAVDKKQTFGNAQGAIKAVAITDGKPFSLMAEYDAPGTALLFTVTDKTMFSFACYATAKDALKVQCWAREGDRFGNVAFEVKELKSNEWTVTTGRFVELFKTASGTGELTKSGLGVRNICFLTGVAPGTEFFVDDVVIYEPETPDALAGAPEQPEGPKLYAAFQEEFLELLRKRDAAAVSARLDAAEADPRLKPFKPDLAANRRALVWLADLDAALTRGIDKLKEIDHFELQMTKGEPLRVGKSESCKFTGLKGGALQLTSKGATLPVSLDLLQRETQDRLIALGFGLDATSRLRTAFLSVLTLRSGTGPSSITSVQAALKGAKTVGAGAEDIAWVEQLLSTATKETREADASAAWNELVKSADTKPAKALKEALAAFKTRFGDTKFVAGKQAELRTLASKAEGIEVSEGLIGYWRLDDGTGASAADSSGNNHPGTLVDNPAWITGRFKGALSFDGKKTCVSIPHQPAFNAYPMTLSAWFQMPLNAGGPAGIVDKSMTTSKEGYRLVISADKHLRAVYFTDGGRLYNEKKDIGLEGGPVTDEAWHHAVFTADAAGAKIYFDGVLKESLPWSGKAGPTTTTRPVQIGHAGSSNTHFFSGKIDDVRIYDRALTEAEVQTLFKMKP